MINPKINLEQPLSKKLAIVKKGNSDYYSLTIKSMNEKDIVLAILYKKNSSTYRVKKFIPISKEEYEVLRNIEADDLIYIRALLNFMSIWSLKVAKLPENIKDVIIRDEICNPEDPGIDSGARRRTIEIETDEGIEEVFNFLEYESMCGLALGPTLVSESSIFCKLVLPEEDRIRLRKLIYQKYGCDMSELMAEYEETLPIPIIETEQPEKVKIR